jgi:glycosyltransferase involved in cell wall biosynthesis
MPAPRSLRIGFVATRFAGIDGVSLEAGKWADVLGEMGHEVFYFGGIVDRPPERSRTVAEAFFGHPDVSAIGEAVFDGGTGPRSQAVSRRIDELSAFLRERLLAFVREFEVDMLVPENALAIPMHVPLGLAITQLAAESGMRVLAHHHDLPWERQRFAVNAVTDILAAAFPPALPNVHHVCINTAQREQIARRVGRSARVIPNVMDFETLHQPSPDVTAALRVDLGLAPDEVLVLQPVRVIPRKGIEHAVELLARLDRPARLVISHPSGDEGAEYEEHIRELARLLDVRIEWAADRVSAARGSLPDGRPTWTLGDFYDAADLVAYPSLIEGFGNAYLEAVYHRRPVLVNRYPIYDLDIRPLGFRDIEMNGYLTEANVAETLGLLDDPVRVRERTDWNYGLGLRYFSYEALRRGLRAALADLWPDDHLQLGLPGPQAHKTSTRWR